MDPWDSKMLRTTVAQNYINCGKFQKTLNRKTCAPVRIPTPGAPREHVTCFFSVLFTLHTHILFLHSTIQRRKKRPKLRATNLMSLLLRSLLREAVSPSLSSSMPTHHHPLPPVNLFQCSFSQVSEITLFMHLLMYYLCLLPACKNHEDDNLVYLAHG